MVMREARQVWIPGSVYFFYRKLLYSILYKLAMYTVSVYRTVVLFALTELFFGHFGDIIWMYDSEAA